MLPSVNPTNTPALAALQKHYEEMKNVSMRDLFSNDADRYTNFSLRFDDIFFDYSKNIISKKI